MQMLSVLNAFNSFPLAELEVGHHFYWQLGNLKIHGQVFLTSWFVISILVVASIAATRNAQRIPKGIQNLMEYALEFIRDLAKKTNLVRKSIALGYHLLVRYSCLFSYRTGQVR